MTKQNRLTAMDDETKGVLRAIILLQSQMIALQAETGMSDDEVCDAVMELIENGRVKVMEHPDGTFRLRIIGGLRGFKLKLLKGVKELGSE